MQKTKLGIIGFGDFGQLLVKHLHPFAEIVVSSSRPQKSDFCQFGSIEEALSQDVIIPSLPAQYLEEFFTQHAAVVNPNALVVDVCSVKVNPIKALQKTLPTSVEILATHPLFGPASAKNGLKNLRIMLHPTRINPRKYETLRHFCADTLQLNVIECTPEEHDEMMAYAQGLSHFIGRVMQEMDIPKTPLATRAYEDLLDMKAVQGGDSWALFESIMFENPYALEVNQKFKQAIKHLDDELGIK